jgi:hypothetical protein
VSNYRVKWFFLLLYFIFVSVGFNFFGIPSIHVTYFNTEHVSREKDWEAAMCAFA